jgi:hypothetical protein
MITTLFGLPYYITSIDKNTYDKNNIISSIKKNYDLSSYRNSWDKNNPDKCNIHQSLEDETNENFLKVNYNSLQEIYNTKIKQFFNTISPDKSLDFSFKIVNYTCMKENQFMRSHFHHDCDFAAIHYLNFKKEIHTPTTFINGQDYIKYMKYIRPKLENTLDNTSLLNSWCFGFFNFNTTEDDFHIFPSFLEHSVGVQKFSDEPRITLALNIYLK